MPGPQLDYHTPDPIYHRGMRVVPGSPQSLDPAHATVCWISVAACRAVGVWLYRVWAKELEPKPKTEIELILERYKTK